VDEDGQEMGPAVGTGTSKKNITWEKNHSHRTSRLIAWCKANEDARIKLFSDSGKDAKEQGRKKKQSGTSKDTYYLQLANAIFSKDEDPEVQLLFQKDPKSFIKPIQSVRKVSILASLFCVFIPWPLNRCFRLKKKYNEFNKDLKMTGAGKTYEELQQEPEMKSLISESQSCLSGYHCTHLSHSPDRNEASSISLVARPSRLVEDKSSI
jgi:hypothetical protein